jgi:hypothetical protein
VKEDRVAITNAEVAQHAREVAAESTGLRRMAAVCVCAAAVTTGTRRNARKALDVISHPGLRVAAQLLLAELTRAPAAADGAGVTPKVSREPV